MRTGTQRARNPPEQAPGGTKPQVKGDFGLCDLSTDNAEVDSSILSSPTPLVG